MYRYTNPIYAADTYEYDSDADAAVFGCDER